MFGKNAVVHPFPDADGSLLVNDIFYTIQGEGPDAGRTAVFLRLSKCNLRCYFCDTEFERGARRGLHDLAGEIRVLARRNKCGLVVITGGEPCLQNFLPLVQALNAVNLDVAIETAGTVVPNDNIQAVAMLFGARNKIVCSPKTGKVNAALQEHIHSYKYIVRADEPVSDKDGLPMFSTQLPGKKSPLARPPAKFPLSNIYVQACDENDPVRNVANLSYARDIALRYGYRMSIQTHKLIGVP